MPKFGDKVIHPSQLPTKLPFSFTILLCLFLDRIHAREWVWTLEISLLVLMWIEAITSMYQQRFTKLLELQD